jgi:putative colanic acid biosysnthesis UDP-glucose lipid carrier transferase
MKWSIENQRHPEVNSAGAAAAIARTRMLAKLSGSYVQAGEAPVLPITTATVVQPLDHWHNRAVKRAFDVLFSSLMLLLMAWWLFPLMWIVIRLDSKGPLFFIQRRNKKNGRVFRCFKFRTMVVNPEADLTPANDNDRRITRVGRWLRKFHIDEYPQFINVLIGDMSVVGPRPHMIIDNLLYFNRVHRYDARHRVKPGITGLAQVAGFDGRVRNLGEMEQRVQLDLLYARHWSMTKDLLIIRQTILKVFRPQTPGQ